MWVLTVSNFKSCDGKVSLSYNTVMTMVRCKTMVDKVKCKTDHDGQGEV